MGMKLLITGGCGFIGSNFIRHIINTYDDYQVTNLDKITYAGNPENLSDMEDNPRYEFIKGDICDDSVVDRVVKDTDAVINFAAESHVDRSIIDPSSFVRTNIFGTYVLLEAAKKYKVKKFIQISTDEVYGSILKGHSKEDDPLEPNSPYSASKAAADLLARSYFVTFKLPVVIVRSTNNFGPYQYPEKLISLFTTNAIENKSLPLYADGSNVRDWLFVLDNCTGIDLALHKGDAGQIYNIAGENEKNNLQITNHILDILKKPDTLIKHVADRPGHDKRYALNCQKLKALGWRRKYTFEQALTKTVEWYKDNARWWAPLKEKMMV